MRRALRHARCCAICQLIRIPGDVYEKQARTASLPAATLGCPEGGAAAAAESRSCIIAAVATAATARAPIAGIRTKLNLAAAAALCAAQVNWLSNLGATWVESQWEVRASAGQCRPELPLALHCIALH